MRLAVMFVALAFAPPAIAQEAPKTKAPDPDKVICRRVQETGTILGGVKECHTRAEWTQISERARADRENRSLRQGVSKKDL